MEIFIFIGIGCIAFLVIIAVFLYQTYEAPGVRAGIFMKSRCVIQLNRLGVRYTF